MWFEDEDYQEASPFFTCRSPAQQLLYYSLSNLPPSGPDTPPLVFTNLEDVLDAAARNPGSKIKVFHDEISAIQYSYLHYSTQGTVPLVELRSNGEAQLPFRAPSKQDLMKFRKTIEQGDLETFLRYLWCNPRFLVSEGDTAVILQEGFRYNALHVAVKAKQPSFCEYILNTVTSRRFLRLLYPQDDDVTLQNRIFILADQYLNTPEKGRLETPLHFAAKFGCFHCCRCLLMYHQCDKTRRNKDGETAHDVVCSREGSPDLKKKIQDLFTNMSYVPLLRSPDNTLTPKVGFPCSALPTTSPLLSGPSQEMQVKAYAGPMASHLAQDFFRQWKQSPRPSKVPELNRLRTIRLTDSEKGLETYGRHLSQDFNVNWSEYWPFLDAWCNFQTHTGLAKLEAHLIETKLRVALQKKQLKNTFLKEDMPLQIGDSPFVISIKPRTFWEDHGEEAESLCEALKFPSLSNVEELSLEATELGPVQTDLLKLVYFIYLSLPHLLTVQKSPHSCREKELDILKSIRKHFEKVESSILEASKDGSFEMFNLENFHQSLSALVVSCYQHEHEQHLNKLVTLLRHLLEDKFEGDVTSQTFVFHSPSPTRGQRRKCSPELCQTPKSKSWKGNTMRERRRLFETSPPDPDDPTCPNLDRHYWCVVRQLVLHPTPAEMCSCHCRLFSSLRSTTSTSLVDSFSHLSVSALFPSVPEEDSFYTPPQSPSNSQQLPRSCFLTGELPNKLDLDVKRAIKPSLVTRDMYPNVHRWLEDISRYSADETKKWMSPSVRAPLQHTRLHPIRSHSTRKLQF